MLIFQVKLVLELEVGTESKGQDDGTPDREKGRCSRAPLSTAPRREG